MKKLMRKDIILIVGLVCFVACLALEIHMEVTMPGPNYVIPQITLEEVGPCIYEDGAWVLVEVFDINDSQHICAQMETDTSPVGLTLIIERTDNSFVTVYADYEEFEEGFILFSLDPILPPGHYRAHISWARPRLADFFFEVDGR